VNWRSKVIEALLLLAAVAVVARVVFGLLGPLLPSLVAILVLGGLLSRVLRGPHAGR
jgi:hypothetical protein